MAPPDLEIPRSAPSRERTERRWRAGSSLSTGDATRHILRFGELEPSLADADLAQLHGTLTRLHGFPDPTVQRLCAQLRQLLDDRDNDGAGSTLQLDAEAARKVQLAVYCDQAGRKPVSPALAHARRQAFPLPRSEQN